MATEHIDQLLLFAIKHGISDVHLRVGRPAYFRRDGQLVTRKGGAAITDSQMSAWFSSMAADRLQSDFTRLSEIDFGYDLPGQGRFRVNAYRQRGVMAMVLRKVLRDHSPSKIIDWVNIARSTPLALE